MRNEWLDRTMHGGHSLAAGASRRWSAIGARYSSRTTAAALGAVLLFAAAAPAAAQQTRPPVAPLRLVMPPLIDSAIAHGTRTATGIPGPHYWQNSANYDIDVQITPADSMLHGQESVTYRNNSPNTLHVIVLRLYQNLMGPYSSRSSPTAHLTQGMIMEQLKVNGVAIPLPPQPTALSTDPSKAQVNGTLMTVPLPSPLLPGGTATLSARWHFTIPGSWAPRMGMVDDSTAQIAQWYPQVDVYDDIRGWDQEQYTGRGEFYLDYGNFHYAVTVPAGYIVGGSGVLQNPDEVLTAAERAALQRAASTSGVVHVLTSADFGAGKATKGTAGGTLTWRFTADSVRDVAFSFGNHYLWDATSAVVDSATGRRAQVNVFYRQGAPRFDQVWKMAQYALETHSSRMVPYVYPQLTETEGGSGGMEYPMTVFVGAYQGLYREDEVTAHEIGHEWFPMLVGSNETRHGWQDEGLNTFDTYFATDTYLPDSVGLGLHSAQRGYVAYVLNSDEPYTMMSPANGFGVVPNSGYTAEAYYKPSSVLYALLTTLGHDEFYKAYRAYIHRWEYKHPTAYDFFNTFNNVTGRNLDPFWVQWFFTNGKLDQAVAAVHQTGNQLSVTVRNVGRVYAPVDVTARTANGKTVTWREPMTAWYDGRSEVTTSHTVPGTVTSVELDAAHAFPDVHRGNNVWKKK